MHLVLSDYLVVVSVVVVDVPALLALVFLVCLCVLPAFLVVVLVVVDDASWANDTVPAPTKVNAKNNATRFFI